MAASTVLGPVWRVCVSSRGCGRTIAEVRVFSGGGGCGDSDCEVGIGSVLLAGGLSQRSKSSSVQAREDVNRETVGGGRGETQRQRQRGETDGRETDGREGGEDRQERGRRKERTGRRGKGREKGTQRQEDGWMVRRGRPGGEREERSGDGE